MTSKIALGDPDAHLIHGSPCPPEFASQTELPSVQPFCGDHRCGVRILERGTLGEGNTCVCPDMSQMDIVNISFNWAAAMRSVAIGTVTICALINAKVVGEHNKLLCSPIILVFCAESRTQLDPATPMR